MSLITAKEAAQLSARPLNAVQQGNLNQCDQAIRDACTSPEGHRSVQVHFTMYANVIGALQDAGFKVHSFHANHHLISW